MPEQIQTFLREHPVGLLFLVIGLGYLLGRIRIRSFDLGSVTGVLFIGLVFGHFGYEMSPTVQTLGFVCFIFSVGVQAGPRFFSVLKTDGLRYMTLAIVVGGSGFVLALTLSKLLDLDHGASAGILAGGLTTTPTLAAAQEAVLSGQVPVPEGVSPEQVVTNITTSYAITYIFGLIGLILIIRLLPKVLGLDLKAEAAEIAREQSGGLDDATRELPDIVSRAVRITSPEVTGVPIAELYDRYPGLGSVVRLRRQGEELEVEPDVELELDDELVVVGQLDHVISISGFWQELSDRTLTAGAIESARIIVLRSRIKHTMLSPRGIVDRYGCFIAQVHRLGVSLAPEEIGTLESGDVVHVTGPDAAIDRLGADLGHIERSVDETDLVTFGLGIAVGTLIGGLSVTVGGISIGLGSAGGLLAAGLTIGFLRAIRPTFGRVPGAARWVFMELGLLMFMAGVGLRAGSGVVETVTSAGPSLFLAGALITVVPVFIGFAFGRVVLGMKPVLLLGGITGSMTSGAALGIINREADSSVPSLGYTGAYAFANILLTIAGSLILLF